MDWLDAPDLWPARWLFTRSLGAVYIIAFVNVALQFRALLGSHGLTPVSRYVELVTFHQQPSLFHLHHSDRFALAVAWVGVALSAALTVGLPQAGPEWLHLCLWLVVWALYLSYVNVGQIWYGFGWESILLEAGFLAAFLGSDRTTPSRLGILLVLWLLFRVEVGAGLIKLRGDRCWRDLTCLEYHHETQPLPGPFSWYAHHLPRWWHRMEVLGNYVAQLVAPFMLFLPQPAASIAAVAVIITQGWLVLTGNFAWLNVLTMVLATAALADDWLAWLPVDPPTAGDPPSWLDGLVLAVAVATVVMSFWPVRNMLSRSQVMNARYNPLHLVGTYGAFGGITRQRYELVVEGTADEDPGPDSEWLAYAFRAKPGEPGRRPPQVAPYHLRLDWLLWFAAMSPVVSHRWLFTLLLRLLEADPHVLGLLRRSPFLGRPPTAVRVLRYRYRFTTPAQRRETGDWWVRRRVGEPVPPLRLGADGQLVRTPL
jgi:hypothetical protein